MSENKNILERVLLLMKYNNKNTLSENLNLIVEQPQYLDENRQSSLATSVGAPNIPFLKVKNQDEWYAAFAVWYAQEIETAISSKLGYGSDNFKCENTNKLNYPIENINLYQSIINNLNPKSSKSDKLTWEEWGPKKYANYNVCRNDLFGVNKPFYKINWSTLSSEYGRLSRNSFKGYNGYIPSYSEVIKAYGPNYSNLINLIDKTQREKLLNLKLNPYKELPYKDTKSVFENKKVDLKSVHDFLTIIQVGLLFTGPAGWLFDALITMGESFMFSIEDEMGANEKGDEMAAFLLILSALPSMKFFVGASQAAKEVYQSVFKKISKGQFTNFSDLEIKFLNDLTKIDVGGLAKDARVLMVKKINEVLSSSSNLSKETIKGLQEVQRKLTSKWVYKLDVVLSIAASFGLTEIGRTFVSSLYQKLFDSGVEMTDEETKILMNDLKKASDPQIEAISKEIEQKPEKAKEFAKNPEYRQKLLTRYDNLKVKKEVLPDTIKINYPKDYDPYSDN